MEPSLFSRSCDSFPRSILCIYTCRWGPLPLSSLPLPAVYLTGYEPGLRTLITSFTHCRCLSVSVAFPSLRPIQQDILAFIKYLPCSSLLSRTHHHLLFCGPTSILRSLDPLSLIGRTYTSPNLDPQL